jgi:hypothetical protein
VPKPVKGVLTVTIDHKLLKDEAFTEPPHL